MREAQGIIPTKVKGQAGTRTYLCLTRPVRGLQPGPEWFDNLHYQCLREVDLALLKIVRRSDLHCPHDLDDADDLDKAKISIFSG